MSAKRKRQDPPRDETNPKEHSAEENWNFLCFSIRNKDKRMLMEQMSTASRCFGSPDDESDDKLLKLLQGLVKDIKAKRKAVPAAAQGQSPKQFGLVAFAPLVVLPANIVLEILALLDIPAVNQCARVGKLWRGFANDPDVWAYRGLDLCNALNRSATQTEVLAMLKPRRYARVTKFCVPSLKLGKTAIRGLSAVLPALKALDFSRVTGSEHLHLEQLVVHYPNLTELNLNNVYCPNTRTLRNLTKLRSLKMDNSHLNVWIIFMQEVNDVKTSACLDQLCYIPCLEVLSLDAGKTVFDVPGDRIWPANSEAHIASLSGLWKWPAGSMPNLRTLIMRSQWKLDDDLLNVVALACTGLHELDLQNLSSITGAGLRKLACSPMAQTLKRLRLDGCGRVHQVNRGFGHNKTLYPRGPCNITPDDVAFASSRMPCLVEPISLV